VLYSKKEKKGGRSRNSDPTDCSVNHVITSSVREGKRGGGWISCIDFTSPCQSPAPRPKKKKERACRRRGKHRTTPSFAVGEEGGEVRKPALCYLGGEREGTFPSLAAATAFPRPRFLVKKKKKKVRGGVSELLNRRITFFLYAAALAS